jgi:peptidoglycan hydrolase-like protein with peptidoglycan-binding domain
MAGSVVTMRGLIFGLGLGATAIAAFPGAAVAEPPDPSGTEIAQGVPPPPPATNAPTPEQVEAIAKAQKCLADLGYYQGAVDGKRGKQTWTAFWNFKQEHGLKAYSDLLAEPVQQKLAALCKAQEEAAAAAAARADPLYQPEEGEVQGPNLPAVEDGGEEGEEDVAVAFPDGEDDAEIALEPRSRLDLDCLPEDLAALLQRAHGSRRWVKQCERPCLPTPRSLAQRYLDEMQAKNGVVWCRVCVPIEGRLALEDVRRIEKAGDLQLCATPPRKLPRYGEGAADGLRSYMRVRALYGALPPGEEDPDAFAVVIGNRSYDTLPRSATSYNDADAVYSFLTEHLGYRPDNMIDLRDATKAEFDKVFGAKPGEEGDLERLLEGQRNAKLLIYYSGHGATDEGQNEVYLLPVDSVPHREEIGGYKLSTLYANLARLKLKSSVVLLETEYGRDHSPYVLPPNLPETLPTALPRTPVPGLTVIAATDRGQRSLMDMTYDVGLFTRYLIEGLAGNADLAPIGNGDGRLDTAEIYAYTAAFVDLAARKSFGLLQHPIHSGAATTVLTSARSAPPTSN